MEGPRHPQKKAEGTFCMQPPHLVIAILGDVHLFNFPENGATDALWVRVPVPLESQRLLGVPSRELIGGIHPAQIPTPEYLL